MYRVLYTIYCMCLIFQLKCYLTCWQCLAASKACIIVAFVHYTVEVYVVKQWLKLYDCVYSSCLCVHCGGFEAMICIVISKNIIHVWCALVHVKPWVSALWVHVQILCLHVNVQINQQVWGLIKCAHMFSVHVNKARCYLHVHVYMYQLLLSRSIFFLRTLIFPKSQQLYSERKRSIWLFWVLLHQ